MNMHHLRRAITILVLIIASTSSNWSSATSLPQSGPEGLWINIPSSPLEVKFTSSKRDSLLVNRSSGRVVRYRLGCVSEAESSKLKVARKTPWVETDLESGKLVINSVSVHAQDLERCDNTNSRLAVVEVAFQDGFFWRAK